MRTIFESVRADIVAERGQKVYDEGLGSLIYLESLSKVMSHYVRGMFLYYHWQETGDAATAARAENELQEWRAAWADYQTNIPKLPGTATLYRSQTDQDPSTTPGAMADTCEAALRSLALRVAPIQNRKVAQQQAAPAIPTQTH
jgi:hypothetical protein